MTTIDGLLECRYEIIAGNGRFSNSWRFHQGNNERKGFIMKKTNRCMGPDEQALQSVSSREACEEPQEQPANETAELDDEQLEGVSGGRYAGFPESAPLPQGGIIV